MKTSGQDHRTREQEAREWDMQERARLQARDAATAAPAVIGFGRVVHGQVDAAAASITAAASATRSYRRIAQALRSPPPVELPPDFAAQMARMAETLALAPAAATVHAAAADPVFERVLMRALVAAFALGALVVGLVYGARVVAQLQIAIGVQGVQWTALVAGCLGLSWLLDRLRALAGHGHGDSGRRAA